MRNHTDTAVGRETTYPHFPVMHPEGGVCEIIATIVESVSTPVKSALGETRENIPRSRYGARV